MNFLPGLVGGGPWERTCQQSWRPVYALAYRACRSRAEAEDITQETFSRAWPQLHAGKVKDDRVQAYLFEIARNLIRDRWRRQQRNVAWLERLMELPQPTADPEQTALWSEESRTIRNALAQLSSEEQRVLKLRLWDGVSSEECAAQLGKTAGAIRQIQHRALVEVRRILSAEGVHKEYSYEG